MSFRCDLCDRPIRRAHAKPIQIILETRPKVYPERRGKVKAFDPRGGDRGERREVDRVIDPGGSGWEIVKEAGVCKRCAAERKAPKEQSDS